jgi:predicted neutral ceramidase superfamily lipid hydrolase
MTRSNELGLELIALEQMLKQMKIDCEACSSLAEGRELEKRMAQFDKQFEATQSRIEKSFNKQMAKAKARGLLLH